MRKSLYRVTIRNFFVTFLVLIIIASLPGIFFGLKTFHDLLSRSAPIIIYWLIIAFFFCAFTSYQKYRAFDRPMRQLSKAAQKVAAGDFSIYIDTTISGHQKNYMTQMITDFNKMVAELGTLETMKSDLISNVSHELKTPLAVIQNYATALQDPNLKPNIRQYYLNEIISAANNLAKTVSNILLLNKFENQQIIPDKEPYNLTAQLGESLLSFETKIDEKQLDVHANFDDKIIINFDKNISEIIWRNLLSNAIKFSHKNGKLIISATQTAHYAVISIIDNGVGMTEETLKHLFDKFYQGDISHIKEGNGLGLALTKRIVELANGTITVTSELNKGTQFIVKIPTS